MTDSIDEIIGRGPDEAPAIAAVDRPALTYRGLRRQVDRTVAALQRCGIGRGDLVGLVLPNGPEMATAFVALAASAVAAPLNPAYRADEFESYHADLQAKALIVPAGAPTPARAVAARHGIRILELSVSADAAARRVRAAGARRCRIRAGRGGAVRGRRGGPGAAHLRHHLATQDRAADAAQPLRLGGPCAPRPRSRTANSASTSCRCYTSTAWWRPCSRPLPRRGRSRPGSRPALLRLADQFAPTWYMAVRRCTRRSWRAPRNPESVGWARLRLVRSSSAVPPPRYARGGKRLFGAVR